MKKALILIHLLFGISAITWAQEAKSEFELIRSIFETEKRGIYEQYMDLTDQEELVFWPLYEDYEIERSAYSKKRLDALRFFVQNYATLTNKQASDFVNDIFKYQRMDTKLSKKYFRLMSAKMSEKKAVRFIQIEEYIHTKIKLQIIEALPFVRD